MHFVTVGRFMDVVEACLKVEPPPDPAPPQWSFVSLVQGQAPGEAPEVHDRCFYSVIHFILHEEADALCKAINCFGVLYNFHLLYIIIVFLTWQN